MKTETLNDQNRRPTRIAAISCMALLLMATSGGVLAATYQVTVNSDYFDPSNITIHPGDTVTWTNPGSSMPHSVTSGQDGVRDGLFDGQGTKFTLSHTFPKAGNFPYYCAYHYQIGMQGSVTVVAPPPPPSQPLNISTRLRIKDENSVLIGGMIATGTVDKKVIILAIGPTLTDFGVAGAIQDPTLDLFRGDVSVGSNDDWKKSPQQTEIANSGFAPGKDAESAIIATLNPNQNYTAVVRGKNGETGLGVVEAFDLDQAASSKLGNISTRGFVDVDDNVMIAGVIVGPSNGGTTKILVRALGPTLGDFNIQGYLADPTLDLVNASGTVIRSNDNWKLSQRTEIENSGLAPGHDEESALIETLSPASYTAVVRGSNRTTGLGLVEIYNIP
jgi:plastocyanin